MGNRSENPAARQSQIAFYLLFAFMGLVIFWLIRAYLGVIAFTFVTVIVLKPLYNQLLRGCRGREKLAMTLTLLVGLALPLMLLWVVGSLVATQVHAFVERVQEQTAMTRLAENITAYVAPFLRTEGTLTVNLLDQLRQVMVTAMSWLAGTLVNVGIAIPTLLVDLFVFVVLVGALLPNFDRFVQWLEHVNPLADEIEELFLRRITTTVQSMFIGIFLIALAQGLVMGIFFWWAQIPYAFLSPISAGHDAGLPAGCQ